MDSLQLIDREAVLKEALHEMWELNKFLAEKASFGSEAIAKMNEISQKVETIALASREKEKLVAVLAGMAHEEISEGQASKILGIGRIEFRELEEKYRETAQELWTHYLHNQGII